MDKIRQDTGRKNGMRVTTFLTKTTLDADIILIKEGRNKRAFIVTVEDDSSGVMTAGTFHGMDKSTIVFNAFIVRRLI